MYIRIQLRRGNKETRTRMALGRWRHLIDGEVVAKNHYQQQMLLTETMGVM